MQRLYLKFRVLVCSHQRTKETCFKYGPSQAPFWIHFFWYIVKLQLINFTMVNDERKQERRRKNPSITRKSRMPSKKRLNAILNGKKPKSVLGFKPGPARTHAVTLPLAPLPLPRHQSYERFTSLCLQTCEYKCFLKPLVVACAAKIYPLTLEFTCKYRVF